MAPADKKGETKVYLEDEEAINKMLKEIGNQQRGRLEDRIRMVSIKGIDLINVKQFTKLVKDELFMEDSDLLKLIRVAKFNEVTKKDKVMPQKLVVKNILDRVESSA
jgi:hypothetical protein